MSDTSNVPNSRTHISIMRNGNLVWMSREEFNETIAREQEAVEQNIEPENSGEQGEGEDSQGAEEGSTEQELKVEIEPATLEASLMLPELEVQDSKPADPSAEIPEGSERIF